MNEDGMVEDDLGITCCDGCGAMWCRDLAQDRQDHEEYHRLVRQGRIRATLVGQGPLRLLRAEIERANI